MQAKRNKLTRRQMEVAALVVEGLSAKAISRRLKSRYVDRALSPGTIQQYIGRIAARIEGTGSPRSKIMRWWYVDQKKAA
jgi:DNA-binding NarL/FixJ family response regulator